MRVPRTFVFVDLSGFTNYTAAFGDDAAGRLLSAFRRSSARSPPSAACASPSGSATAAWSWRSSRPTPSPSRSTSSTAPPTCARRSRCAPASPPGYALLFEGDDYIGSAVNMAARLCDIADALEVLMPTMDLERLPEGVDGHAVRRRSSSRGFPGPIDVFELTGSPTAARNDTGELWTRTPFI